MVSYVDDRDNYQRGCNDGTSFVLALVLLLATVALVVTNYLATWPVFFPVCCLVAAVVNFATFSANPLLRFRNVRAVVFFAAFHFGCLLAGAVFLGLLVTRTHLFLSPDCLGCHTDYAVRDDAVCARAMHECRGLGKLRFAIFVLFPLGAGCLVMEIVNVVTALLAWINIRKEAKVA